MGSLPSPAELAGTIDQTLLKAEATADQIDELCDGAGRDGKSKATHDEPES